MPAEVSMIRYSQVALTSTNITCFKLVLEINLEMRRIYKINKARSNICSFFLARSLYQQELLQ